jgi:hypothetical protein
MLGGRGEAMEKRRDAHAEVCSCTVIVEATRITFMEDDDLEKQGGYPTLVVAPA